MKQRLKTFLKVIASVSILAVCLSKVSFGSIWQTLVQAKYGFSFLVLAFGFVGMWRQSERWRGLLLCPPEDKPTQGTFFRYFTIGFFFNLFVPSGFGGDAARSLAFGRAHQMVGKSFASTVVARIIGFQALVVYMLIGLAIIPHIESHQDVIRYLAIFGISFLLATTLGFVILFRWGQSLISKSDSKSRIIRIAGLFLEYSSHTKLLVFSFFDSLIIQGLILLTNWCMYLALGVNIPFSLILAVNPMITLATMLPISFLGVGVREWASLELFGALSGLSQTQVLAPLVLGYVLMVLQAIAGAFLWILETKKKS